MQEFARKNTPPPAPPGEHWPSAEELAAYIDGKLSKAEAQRITEHLASCEDCYSVYAETLQFQLESSPAPPESSKVVPFRRRAAGHGAWWWRSVAAAAAMVIVAVGGGGFLFVHFLTPPPALPTRDVTAAIPGWVEPWLGPVHRGRDGGEEEIPIDPASFQIGVQIVNLQVKLRANEGGQAQNIVAQTLQILDKQTLLPVSDLEAGYKDITVAIAQGAPPQSLGSKASDLAKTAREIFDSDHLDFGQWVEAGKLASQAQTPSFFQQPVARGFLRHFLWRQRLGIGETKVDPEALRSLQEISRIFGKDDLGASDYAKLRASFERILEIYYPQT